jgi:hypothetical protein
MKQLQEASINMAYCDQSEPLQQSTSYYLVQQMDAMNLVQDLSTQLLNLVRSNAEINSLAYILRNLILQAGTNIVMKSAEIRA